MIKRPNTDTFEDVLQRATSRRGFLRAAFGGSAAGMVAGCAGHSVSRSVGKPEGLEFNEVSHTIDDTLEVPEHYAAQVLIRWGDPLFENQAPFDPHKQTASEQARRFGYNNDFIGFLSLPLGSTNSDHGLLVVNHEYTNSELMFPEAPRGQELSEEQALVDIAAHGMSVIEIKRKNGEWQSVKDSPYTRRVTPDTPMRMVGPAAGSKRLRTLVSKDGVETFGTYGNCAGGVTPWGTVLTGEENVDGFFLGDPDASAEAENYRRFGVGKRYKNWGRYFARWDLDRNPRELLHSGWIVEIDPFDPNSTPRKRTALGRFKHEGCNVYLNKDGRVVGYMGDDQQFEYIYKFVSDRRYDPDNREANMRLLDEGVLYCARFYDDGRVQWLPLVFGEGPLIQENGFQDQGDVVIDARRAADLLGATPMDRPEDVEANPANGHIYAMLTNNSRRPPDRLNAANPRPHNANGQIVEFWPGSGDHSDEWFQWSLFLLAGEPGKVETLYHPDISAQGWLSCPDNCAFDSQGNLWVASDGAQYAGVSDGLWACHVDGPKRALTRRFMRIPIGAELCGPFFTPDDSSLFCSVQHPASGSTFSRPSTRWPDFDPEMPPRPAVIVTQREDGGKIGA